MIYPSISIIVPTIGRNTLRRTIQSVLDCKYPNLDIILVSDRHKELLIDEVLKGFKGITITKILAPDSLTHAQAKNKRIVPLIF